MASTTYYLTDSSNIDNIQVSAGNLLFCEDNKRIFFDSPNGRVCYDSIVIFQTQDEMYAYENPFDGFYFVEESKVLWRYHEGEWDPLTNPPLNSIRFIPESDLPEEGDFEVLYVCGTKQFIWEDGEYKPLTADSIWYEI